MKRILILFLSIILAVSLLAGCNNVVQSPSTTPSITPSTAPFESQVIEPSPTQDIPSETPIEPTAEPSPTVIPPNSTYIEYYDMYVDLTKTKELSRDIIYWAEKSPSLDALNRQGAITTMYTTEDMEKEIYLSFNLGYEHVRGNTEKLLDILKQRNIKATFFLVGEFIKDFPGKVQAIFDDGHTLGAHSYFHTPPSYTMTDEEYIEDFIKTEQLLEIALADKYVRMHFYRPISGEFCERDLYIAKALGYQTVLFDATYGDWNRTIINGSEFAYNELKKDVHKGAIYQLHIVTPDNIEALPKFLDELIVDGWTFKVFE